MSLQPPPMSSSSRPHATDNLNIAPVSPEISFSGSSDFTHSPSPLSPLPPASAPHPRPTRLAPRQRIRGLRRHQTFLARHPNAIPASWYQPLLEQVAREKGMSVEELQERVLGGMKPHLTAERMAERKAHKKRVWRQKRREKRMAGKKERDGMKSSEERVDKKQSARNRRNESHKGSLTQRSPHMMQNSMDEDYTEHTKTTPGSHDDIISQFDQSLAQTNTKNQASTFQKPSNSPFANVSYSDRQREESPRKMQETRSDAYRERSPRQVLESRVAETKTGVLPSTTSDTDSTLPLADRARGFDDRPRLVISRWEEAKAKAREVREGRAREYKQRMQKAEEMAEVDWRAKMKEEKMRENATWKGREFVKAREDEFRPNSEDWAERKMEERRTRNPFADSDSSRLVPAQPAPHRPTANRVSSDWERYDDRSERERYRTRRRNVEETSTRTKEYDYGGRRSRYRSPEDQRTYKDSTHDRTNESQFIRHSLPSPNRSRNISWDRYDEYSNRSSYSARPIERDEIRRRTIERTLNKYRERSRRQRSSKNKNTSTHYRPKDIHGISSPIYHSDDRIHDRDWERFDYPSERGSRYYAKESPRWKDRSPSRTRERRVYHHEKNSTQRSPIKVIGDRIANSSSNSYSHVVSSGVIASPAENEASDKYRNHAWKPLEYFSERADYEVRETKRPRHSRDSRYNQRDRYRPNYPESYDERTPNHPHSHYAEPRYRS